MIYADAGSFSGELLIAGRAYDMISQIFGPLKRVGRSEASSSSRRRPVEERLKYVVEERLNDVQDTVSKFSMHLPQDFAIGLNRQFANLMDDDAWEADDELISLNALTGFLMTLLYTNTCRRPGIGTNGRGSITASWTEGENRLTVECMPSEKVTLVLSRVRDSGEVERAAFGPIRPERIREVLAPFGPEVWFDR